MNDAEIIALALASIFGPFLTTLVKQIFGSIIDGTKAVWLAVFVSGSLAVFCIWLTGGFAGFPIDATPLVKFSWTSLKMAAVFGLGQLLYKNLRPFVPEL